MQTANQQTANHIKANDGKIYLLPINPVWHNTPPPEPGWYPASIFCQTTNIRWYENGAFSMVAWPTDSQFAASQLTSHIHPLNGVQWTTPWWTPAEQARIHAQAIAAGLRIPAGYEPRQPETAARAWAYGAPQPPQAAAQDTQRQQIAAIEALRGQLPSGTRLHVAGRIVLLTLSGPDLKPGVPDGPAPEDIQSAIGHLRAMDIALQKARAQASQKA